MLMWVAPVMVLPGLYHRWGWPTLIVALAAVGFALWAPTAGRLPWWIIAVAVAGSAILAGAALLGADPVGQLLGRAPRYEGFVTLPLLVAAVWFGARLLGPRVGGDALRTTIVAVSVAAIALGGIALLEAIGARPIETDLVRPGSLAGNATDQGVLGTVFLGVLGHLLLGAWRRVGSVAWWAVAGSVAALAAVVTSASRAAFLALAVVVIALAARVIWTSSRRLRTAGLSLAGVGAIGVVALALPAVRDRLFAVDAFAAKTISDRFTIWADALALISARPWTGVGPSGFMDAVTGVFDDSWYQNVTPSHILDSPHNVVLQVAVAGGVPLLVVVLGFVVAVGIVGVRAARVATGARGDLLWAALTVLPAAGLALSTTLTSPKTLLPLAVLCGALVGRSALGAGRRGWRWVMTAVVVGWGLLLATWTAADAYLLDGTRAALSGRFDAADSAFAAAGALRPWDADIPLTAARALGGAMQQGYGGATDLAAKWADEASQRLPASAAAQEAAGAVALERGELDRAVARLEAAFALSPANPRIAHELGLAAFASGDLDAATTALTRAVQLAPNSEESRRALADVRERLEKER